MSSIQPYGQNNYNSNSNTQASPSTTALAQNLEQIFTLLAGAIGSTGGSNSGGSSTISPTSEAANPQVQAIAQALEPIITQLTGQSVNLLSMLGQSVNSGGAGQTTQQTTQPTQQTTQTNTSYPSQVTQGNTSYPSQVTQGNTSYPSQVTQGGSSYNTGSVSNPSGVTTSGVSTSVSGDSSLSEGAVFNMISTALTQNGDASQNDLSGPQNLQYWDPSTAEGKKNLDGLYNGIVAAHSQFFPNVPISTFAMAVVAEAGAESTLNPTANGGGLLQVTPADAVADYNNHGTPIKDASGNTVLSPGQTWDQNNPETNVLMWAWYNKNSVAEGGVAPNNWGKGQSNGVSNTYGNILANWLGGPGDKLGQGTDYYTNRIQRFFEKIGGSSSDFQSLLNQPLTQGTVNTTTT